MSTVKLHPKTKGIKVEHVCGHVGMHRFHLGILAKAEISNESLKAVEKMAKDYDDQLKISECQECIAKEEYASVRAELAILFDCIGLEMPEELSGSIRQKAWAETVRAFAIRNLVRSVVDLMAAPKMNNMMMVALFHNTAENIGPELKILADKFQEHLLDKNMVQLFYTRGYYIPEMLPAVVIALREAITGSFRYRIVKDAKTWMMWGKFGPHSSSSRDLFLDPNLILRSAVAIMLKPQGTLEELGEMQEFLSKHVTKDDMNAVRYLREQVSSSQELAEIVQVERALRKPSYDDFPF